MYIPENSQQSTPPKVFHILFVFMFNNLTHSQVQANGLLLRPNGNSQFSSNSENVSTNVSTNMSTNVSTPFSQISGISSYDYEDDFTSDDEHSDFSAMTNV